jgi:penicillin amidase
MESKKPARTLRYFVAAILLLLGLGLLCGWWFVHRSLPELDGQLILPGIKQIVLVDRDQWGVPRIQANSIEDLATAQGYVMAQDRLWQMDIIRRVAAGELSEILGPVTLELDRENRTLGLRQAAEQAAARMDPDTRRLAEAYSRGVNRYIETHRGELPLEFTLLRYEPQPWTPMDSFLISAYMWKSLSSTWKQELNRAYLTARAGEERAKDLYVIDSPLDHYIIGGEAEKECGTRPRVSWPNTRPRTDGLQTVRAQSSPANAAWAEARAFLEQFDEDVPALLGSNNWVVSGAHTSSGKPLLANDPHLGLGVPCIWYMIHLEAPGLNAKGFDLPGTPLLVIGHNDHIAWGFTNNGADVQDLYVETFNPANPLEYRVHSDWVAVQVRREVIHVKGQADDFVDVVVTRHGPIVRREGDHGYALRWTATEPGVMTFDYPLICLAKNWNEFRDAMQRVTGPAQNTIYADVDGNIGFIAAARVPVRKNGHGAVPVPGDTDDYEWTGYIPFDELPQVQNPSGGVIATANARTVGPGYRYFLTERWAAPYRTARIFELLDDRKDLRPADMNAIQNDIESLPDRFFAEQLVLAGQKSQHKDPRARELLGRLSSWDGRMQENSVEASFVEFARHSLFHNLLEPYLDEQMNRYEWWDFTSQYESVWLRDKVFLENVLRERPSRWLPQGFASYDELLMASADQAVTELQRRTRSSRAAGWDWGRINYLFIPNPLGRSGLLRLFLSIGPLEQSGSVDTVKAMGHGHGPSMRFVADLSNFDDSLMEVTTGESGQYGSAYYRDQFPAWYGGRGLPEAFSAAAEERARVHRLRLLPNTNAASPAR